MFSLWVTYVVRQVRRGPDPIEVEPPDVPSRPNGPRAPLAIPEVSRQLVESAAPVPA
jgi:hypothetical protein